jgi:hypothetical protein
MPAQTHCGEAHGEVVTRLTTLERTAAAYERHAEGNGHVTRREVDGLRADLDLISESVRQLAEVVAGLRAGQSWWERLLVPVVVAVLVGAATWLK